MHSSFSGESESEPEAIVEVAVKEGMDAICITEHESLWASAPFERLKETSPLIILRGVEINTDMGHMLVYGIQDRKWDDWGRHQTPEMSALLRKVNELGGVVVPAHPFTVTRNGFANGDGPKITVNEDLMQFKGNPAIVALEVCNGKRSKSHPVACRLVGALARNMGVPGTGGSDAHVPEDTGLAYTVFKNPIDSNSTLVAALLSRQFYPRSRALRHPHHHHHHSHRGRRNHHTPPNRMAIP